MSDDMSYSMKRRGSIDQQERTMPSTADRDKAKRGIRARQDAIATLIANHQAEFDEEHAKNRVALGLPPRPNGPTKEQLEERVRKQRERLVKWEEELRMAG